MKVALLFFAIVFGSFVLPAKADCPTDSTCVEHEMNGYSTGQTKWVGATEYTQFKHGAIGNVPEHTWWVKCD